MEKKLKLIIDPVGRFILGEVAGESGEDLSLLKPIIIHVQPNQQGQVQVQTLPLIFSEFLGDKESNVWTYSKKSIVISNAVLDPRLIQQYESIANPQPVQQKEPEVVKLFDE